MPFGVGPPAQPERDPAREQRRLRCGGRAEGRQPFGDRGGVGDQPARTASGGHPRLDEHQPGVRLPPGPPLPREQPNGHVGARDRGVRVARQPGRRRGRQQQFRLAGGLPADAVEDGDRRVRLGERLRCQTGGHQHLAAPDAEHERRRAELGVALLGLVEEAQRRRYVAGPERGEPPALHRVRLVVLLAGGVPQRLGRREVGVRPVHRAERQMYGGPQRQGPRRPDHVVGLPQHRDRPADVLQRRPVVPQDPAGVGTPEQHAGARMPADALHPALQRGQALLSAPRVHQRDPERRQDVGLPLGRLRAGREIPGAPQVVQGDPHVAPVALPDADHLMGHGGVQRRRIGVEHTLRPRQRVVRGREHHRQQFENRVASRCHSTDGSCPGTGPHGLSLYQSAVPRL
ncbi:hypothetical protein SVIRM249S_05873 [Streptomyces viridochromogenes]